MAVLHKEFVEFDKKIRLTEAKKTDLKNSREGLRKQIKSWFSQNKSDEIQPKFHTQGSQQMNTGNNPIAFFENGEKLYPYDLDDGIYFIEKEGENNRRTIEEWHQWVYTAVEGYTAKNPEKKNACIRVVFSDGHHIDLPIYYKEGDEIELAHKADGWLETDPKAFYEWFNKKKNTAIERITRIIKAWKNYQENEDDDLKLPSGFELSILVVENYVEDDSLDDSFRLTMTAILEKLEKPMGFKCLRPTTPVGEDLFKDYDLERRSKFLEKLRHLIEDAEKAKEESNFKRATEILRDKQFGDRFPYGEDRDEKEKSKRLENCLIGAVVNPKPYGS